MALWHERDISHSSAERVVLADSFIALDYILSKLEWILDGLVVYPENMLANLNKTRGLIYSSRVLLALVDAGMSREDAYAIVQRNAMKVWDDLQQARGGLTYREMLEADPEAAALLTADVLDACFDPWAFLARVGRAVRAARDAGVLALPFRFRSPNRKPKAPGIDTEAEAFYSDQDL